MNWFHWLFQPGIFTLAFMVHAYISGTMIAILSALIGVFIVLRRWTFVAHALPKIGFAGATGAVLAGVNPLFGITAFSLGGALAIGNWNRRGRNDVVTALTLVLALGTGALFLALSNSFTENAYSLFFGQVVGISLNQVWLTLGLGAVCIVAMAILYRPLLLTSIHAEWAEARGVPTRTLDSWFLVAAGVAAALTVPLVGILLNFSLLIAPAATAMRLARHPSGVLLWAVGIAVASTWISLILAYDIGWPVGFFVATVTSCIYVASRLIRR